MNRKATGILIKMIRELPKGAKLYEELLGYLSAEEVNYFDNMYDWAEFFEGTLDPMDFFTAGRDSAMAPKNPNDPIIFSLARGEVYAISDRRFTSKLLAELLDESAFDAENCDAEGIIEFMGNWMPSSIVGSFESALRR